MTDAAFARLRLRLLPSVTSDSSDALLSKQQLMHQSASCAYLCAEMVAQPPQHERIVCLRWPYRQHWPRGLVESMVKEICDAERACSVSGAPLQVALELYHFLDGWGSEPSTPAEEERARCVSVCKQGAAVLAERLRADQRRQREAQDALARPDPTPPSVALWSSAGLAVESAPPTGMRRGICVEILAVQVGNRDAERRHREDQRRCYQEALEASTRHWAQARSRLADMAPADGGCRAVVLADTSVMARHQASWARAQSCVDADMDGLPFEVPLLGAAEPVLVLPITGFLPSLQAPNECSRNASGVLESVWDPWKEAQAQLPRDARKRVERRIGRPNHVAALPPASACVAAQLHHMTAYYSRVQDFRSEGRVDAEKAFKAVSDFFDQASTSPEERYRLLWFAVIVPERSEDVLAWLKMQLLDRVRRPDFDPLCWAVARYWAVAMRTHAYRCEGVGCGNDPIKLGDLLIWLDTLEGDVHASRRAQWREHLRKETLWVGQELRVEETHKGSGRRPVPSSVWRAYSTDDPLQARAGLSLEMQRRAMEQFDEILDAAISGRHLALDSGRALLLITGGMARRLFVLSRHVRHFSVMMLNGREAPQGGTNKQVTSLCLKRRVVYQFPAKTRRALAEGEEADEDALVVARRLVTSALREVGEHRRGVVLESFQALHARHAGTPEEQGGTDGWTSEQHEEALGAVAAVVCRAHRAEARHREQLPAEHREQLETLWQRQLTCALHNAACAVSQGLGDVAPLFLETFLEQLCRASEEPLLRFFAARPAWDQIRRGTHNNTGSVAYSQQLKRFVREVLTPLCSGPAALQRLLDWLACTEAGLAAAGTSLAPLLCVGLRSSLPAAQRARVESAADAGSARRPDMPQEPAQRFLDDVAPGHRLWQLEWERRRFLAKAALACFRRQALMAGELHAAGAPGWLLHSALAQLPVAAGARHPGGRRSLSAPSAASQRSLLALLRQPAEGDQRELLQALLAPSEPKELRRLAARLPSDVGAEEDPAPAPQTSATQWLAAWGQQLDLSEAVRDVRRFMEHYTREQVQRLEPPHLSNLHFSSPLDKLQRGYRRQNQQRNGAFGDRDMEWFLLQAIVHHCFHETLDLGKALEDTLDYWHRYYAPPDARSREQLGRSLRLVRDSLLHHLHRSAGGHLDLAHRAQRRKQIDSFAQNQRDIYRDRPRARGVLESLGHRLKGGSEEVKCYVAEGEAQRPWPRVCRALAADPYAESWYCSWLTGPRQQRQHDLSRADTELARHLLCAEADDLLAGGAPEERGLWAPARADGERVVKRVRVGWQPDTERAGLGRPRASQLEKHRPGRAAGAKEPPLGVHEISQVMLRRLVAHAADTARLACLLREPMEDGRESHLALATCPRLKRALEPLTHAVELWPLFLRHVGAERLRASGSDYEFRLALARAGSPAPTATRVAAHRWLQRQGEAVPADYTLGADGAMLEALARALEAGRLPPPLPPSPVWDEREVVGRKRAASSELPMTARAAKRLRVFRAQGEEAWFRGQRLAEHFNLDGRANDWAQQEQRKSQGAPLPCRPWATLSRRIWVEEQGLPMTPHDDAGRLPDIFSLHAFLLHPVVICPRTPGRKMLGGSLPFGPYTRAEHARYVGDMGECILFGAEQQTLLRAFKSAGLCFLATSQDRVSVLKQFLARACVLYLLGRWQHLPLFQGEGKSSFPWLGARWQDGILNLQQLVRQQLRQELWALEPQLAPLRSAWTDVLHEEEAPWRVLAQPEALARLRQATGDPQLRVPPLALCIERLQERALAMGGAASSATSAPLLERLRKTLADRPDKKEGAAHVLLVFPTERHVREAWSTPLDRGGRLMPSSLSKWLKDDRILEALETGTWPALGDGDLREAQQPAAEELVRRPLGLGQHIVVLPPFASYVRGLSESAGRGPRDGHAPFECWAEGLPPQDDAARRYWEALREAQRPLGEPLGWRALCKLYKRVFPAPRVRTRGGDREEPVEGEPCYNQQELLGIVPSSAVDKQELRKFLERGHPQHFRVATTVDLRQSRGFRGATQCLGAAELAREARRLGPGRNLHGARYLHGALPPEGQHGVSAQQVVEAEHAVLTRECAALEEELEEERRRAEARTARELALPRWPPGAAGLCGLHGSRAPQGATSERGAAVVLVAGRAADFGDGEQCPHGFAQKHTCVALYPSSDALLHPCYELQLASLRLLERQLLELHGDRRMLLLAVGAEATRLFKSLHLLLRPNVGATDLVALPGESLPRGLRERARLTIAQRLVGWCSLDQLRNEQFASMLCSRPDQEELRLDWIALRSDLKGAAPAEEQRGRGAPSHGAAPAEE